MVVVLPAPLGPRKPVTFPSLTVKLRSSTARTDPNRLVRFLDSIISSPAPVAGHPPVVRDHRRENPPTRLAALLHATVTRPAYSRQSKRGQRSADG